MELKRKTLLIEWENENEEISSQNQITIFTTVRLYLLLTLILIAYFVIIVKLFNISFYSEEISENLTVFSTKRGNIYDVNNHLLATNLPTKSVYIKPNELLNIENTAKVLAEVINQYDAKPDKELAQKIQAKILAGKNFIWIKRHILPSQYIKIKSLGIPGVYFAEDNKRFYPYENDFSHVVGFVDIDQKGISGIEKQLHEKLSEGNDVYLSLNAKVQSIVRDKLSEAIANHDALGGMAIIMNARNGEIVSLVSLPDFNPNRISINSEAMFNRATLGVYEMGSTFKVLTIAMALDLGLVKLSDSFNVVNPMKLGKYKINDYKFHKANLTLPEVLVFSSNRGVAQVGYKIGIQNQQNYMKNIGMLSLIEIELSEKGRPIYVSEKQWNDVYLATMSYGHGIAVTALHTVSAIAAVTNGGILYKPTLLKNSHTEGVRVFKEVTSKIMRKIMRQVIEEGYGKKAEVPGYNIGGKTGTAEKVKNGRYVKKDCNLVSFFGAFPIDNPQYVIFVAVDEPKPNKLNSGFATGGQVAAPLAAEILKAAGYFLREK